MPYYLRELRQSYSDSIQSALSTFHVAPLSDYDHLRGFQYLNTYSHVRNISFLTQKSTLLSLSNGSSHLFTSKHNLKLPLELVMHGFSVL